MANARFTRDEAILALDVLYSQKNASVTEDALDDLSNLLKRLPIHPQQSNNNDFRTPNGINNQLVLFKRSMKKGEKHPNVGKIFFDIAFEFEDKLGELHKIATAIRENEAFFDESYGESPEGNVFPEGNLLGHLHRSIETQAMVKISPDNRCELCGIQPEIYYQPCGNLLQLHLLVPPIHMNGGKKYARDEYITVCPTCHAALHAYRPWLTRENCGELLR